MKKLLMICLMCLPVVLSAQRTDLVNANAKAKEKKDRVETEKIAFLTKELDLTSDEAQKFWPVYNQYSKEREEIRRQRRESIKVSDEMTDVEATKAIENMLTLRQKELELQRSYINKFLEVLPGKKVAKLYDAEEKFKKVLLDRLNRKQQHAGSKKPVKK